MLYNIWQLRQIYYMAEKIDLITAVQPTHGYSQVLQAHRRLNQQIDQMSDKIDALIDRSEGQFLVAYQNHIRKIKIQLAQIRSKSDAHENQMSKNDRVNYLEKQVSVFRQQALKLYDKLDEKTQQAQIFKLKSKQLERTCYIAQRQVKQHIKQKKVLEARLISAQGRIAELEEQLKHKNEPVFRRPIYSQQSNTKSVLINNLGLRLKEQQQSQQPTVSKTVSLGLKRKSFNSTSFMGNKDDGQLKDWFLQCIRTIKKDVAQRKSSGQQFNFDYIKSIDDFKMVDKLRLLQKFMENEKLLTWMYEKIFPSRMAEVREYLLKKARVETTKKNSIQSEQALKQLQLPQQLQPDTVEQILPKMTDLKKKRSEVRNRVSLRDGKLNLTMI